VWGGVGRISTLLSYFATRFYGQLNLHPWRCTRMYPKVSGLAALSENYKWNGSLPPGAVLSLYFVSQSSEFCRHNPLCCFSTGNTKGKHIFRYRLSPETFGYTLVPFCFVLTHLYLRCVQFTIVSLQGERHKFATLLGKR
jgi:hypothetical protein